MHSINNRVNTGNNWTKYKIDHCVTDDNESNSCSVYRATSLDSLANSEQSEEHCTSDEIPIKSDDNNSSTDSGTDFDCCEHGGEYNPKPNKDLIERFNALKQQCNVRNIVKLDTEPKVKSHRKFEKHNTLDQNISYQKHHRVIKKSKNVGSNYYKFNSKSDENIFDSWKGCVDKDTEPIKKSKKLSKSDNNLSNLNSDSHSVNDCVLSSCSDLHKNDSVSSKSSQVSKAESVAASFKSVDRMETIPEEGHQQAQPQQESKISVKEILARFENMRASQRLEEVNFLDAVCLYYLFSFFFCFIFLC